MNVVARTSDPIPVSDEMRQQLRAGIANVEASIRAQVDGVMAVRSRVVGLAHGVPDIQGDIIQVTTGDLAQGVAIGYGARATVASPTTVEAYAVARVQGLVENEMAVVGRELSLLAGILTKIPEGLSAAHVRIEEVQGSVAMLISVHAEDMDVTPAWAQEFTFYRERESDLLDFKLTPHKIGPKRIRVQYYYEQHWLAEIKFEVEVVEQMSVVTVMQ